MLKLYDLDASPPRYWETWDNRDGTHTVHWGILGERGDSKEVAASGPDEPPAEIQAEIDRFVADGYRPVEADRQRRLMIEYPVDGMGTPEDVARRHRLEDRMNETLGWTGLGHCDGGSIGSGTMEVCCFVVDFELARQVVVADLEGSEFSDHIRIYDEDHDG